MAIQPDRQMLLWFIALVSPVVAFGGSILLYWQYRRLGPKYRIPELAYALVTVVCAIVGYYVGLVVGVNYACSPLAGNLCGLEGFFVTAPLAASFTVLLVDSLILFIAS